MSAVPINFCAFFADVERLKGFQSSDSDFCIDGRSEFCFRLARESLPVRQPLILRELDHWIPFRLRKELAQFLRDAVESILRLNHLQLWCYQELIAIANHTATEDIEAFHVNFKVLNDLLESMQFIVMAVDQITVADPDMFLILRRRLINCLIMKGFKLVITLLIISCLLAVSMMRSSRCEYFMHSSCSDGSPFKITVSIPICRRILPIDPIM